jgi:hypothetical protein
MLHDHGTADGAETFSMDWEIPGQRQPAGVRVSGSVSEFDERGAGRGSRSAIRRTPTNTLTLTLTQAAIRKPQAATSILALNLGVSLVAIG